MSVVNSFYLYSSNGFGSPIKLEQNISANAHKEGFKIKFGHSKATFSVEYCRYQNVINIYDQNIEEELNFTIYYFPVGEKDDVKLIELSSDYSKIFSLVNDCGFEKFEHDMKLLFKAEAIEYAAEDMRELEEIIESLKHKLG